LSLHLGQHQSSSIPRTGQGFVTNRPSISRTAHAWRVGLAGRPVAMRPTYTGWKSRRCLGATPPPIFTGGTGRGRFANRSGQAVTIRDVALPEIPIRLDPPLLRALRRRADTEGVSLNELIRRLLRDGLREQDAGVVGPP